MNDEKRAEKKGSLAQIDLGHEVNGAIENLGLKFSKVRDLEYELREAKADLEICQHHTKEILLKNNALEILKIDMAAIRKYNG